MSIFNTLRGIFIVSLLASLTLILFGCTKGGFEEQNVDSLIAAIRQSEKTEWEAEFISGHAQQFDQSVFREKISRFIQEKMDGH